MVKKQLKKRTLLTQHNTTQHNINNNEPEICVLRPLKFLSGTRHHNNPELVKYRKYDPKLDTSRYITPLQLQH